MLTDPDFFASFRVFPTVTGITLAAAIRFAFLAAEGLFSSQYQVLDGWHLVNAALGLSLVHVAVILPFTVWMLRGFVSGVPIELEEAAMVDALSRTRAFVRITFPLLAAGCWRPASTGSCRPWKEYTLALVVMTDPSQRTLPLWLQGLVEANRAPTGGGHGGRDADLGARDRLLPAGPEAAERRTRRRGGDGVIGDRPAGGRWPAGLDVGGTKVLGVLLDDAAGVGAGVPGLAGDLAFLAPGTGVAAGLLLGGEPRRRHCGGAGEIGHVPVDPTGPACLCGQRGCLELHASGAAIDAAWPARNGRPTAVDLFAAAAAGDATAVRVREGFADAVAAAMRLTVLTCAVEHVVLGGGVAEVGAPLRDAVVRSVRRQAAGSAFLRSLGIADRLQVVPADVPVAPIGAALLVRGLLPVGS